MTACIKVIFSAILLYYFMSSGDQTAEVLFRLFFELVSDSGSLGVDSMILPSISFWQVGVDGWSRRVIQGFRLQRTQDLYCGRHHPDSRQHQRGPQATAPQPA